MSYIHNFGDPIWLSFLPIFRIAGAKQYNVLFPNMVPGIELGVNIGSTPANMSITSSASMHLLNTRTIVSKQQSKQHPGSMLEIK
jgi:hypothetical protein